MKNAELSEKLKVFLGLQYEPVGIKLIKDAADLQGNFADFHEADKNLRHCQSVMMARKGEALIMPAARHSCLVGASSLGLVSTPEKVKAGIVHASLGMYENNEAAANMISQRFEIEANSVLATVVGPLKYFDIDPDVVIIVDLPETVYWLVPSSSYFDGNRQIFNSAPFQATCVDSTVIPLLTGKLNISLGCYGCRSVTDIKNDEIIAGIPYINLEKMLQSLEKLHGGPMQKARKNKTAV